MRSSTLLSGSCATITVIVPASFFNILWNFLPTISNPCSLNRRSRSIENRRINDSGSASDLYRMLNPHASSGVLGRVAIEFAAIDLARSNSSKLHASATTARFVSETETRMPSCLTFGGETSSSETRTSTGTPSISPKTRLLILAGVKRAQFHFPNTTTFQPAGRKIINLVYVIEMRDATVVVDRPSSTLKTDSAQIVYANIEVRSPQEPAAPR